MSIEETNNSVEETSTENQSVSSETPDETVEESETSDQDESTQESKADDESQSDEEGEESNEETESKDEKPGKKGLGVQKKISKLVKKLDMKDQEIEYLKKQLFGKTPQEKVESTTDDQSQISKLEKPKADDFETYEAYTEALTDWKIEQKESEKQAKAKEAQTKTEYQKTLDAHSERVAKFMEKNPSYKDVVEDFIEEHGDINFSFGLQQAVLTSDLSAELMNELLQNKDEVDRLNSLDLTRVAKEIAKLELRLNPDSSPKPVKLTKAASPMKTLNSKSNGTVKKSIFDKDIPFSEYEALRMQELKNKG